MARKANLPNKKLDANPVDQLARSLSDDNTCLPITDTERALFAVCFGKMIDQILTEPD